MSFSAATRLIALPNVRRSPVAVRRVVLVVTAVFTALSWMESVSASCGNYLYRNGKPVSHHSMRMQEIGSVAVDGREIAATPMEIPVRRCSGPNCSSSPLPLAPIPAAPSNLIKGFDQAAVLQALAQGQDAPGTIEIPESERGACFEPSTIFRPPAA